MELLATQLSLADNRQHKAFSQKDCHNIGKNIHNLILTH